MIKVVARDITNDKSEDLGTYDSIQMSYEALRDEDGNEILRYYAPENTWFDRTGNGWYDWTVENA